MFGMVAATVAIACAPTPPPTPTAAPVAPAPTASAASAQRLNGKVQSIASGKVTLDSGSAFTLAPDTRVIRSATATLADIKVGDYVAVTAKRQSDNTLLASAINVFPPSLNGVAPGQRPMTGGNLMTNATVDTVNADGLSVKFPDGTAQVKVAPDAKLMKLVDATQADIKEGLTISALVADNVARSVTIVST
jgi:hypothetical protein